MKTLETKDYGVITIRPAMFDVDGTNLEEGVEIKGDFIGLIEVYGYFHIDDMEEKDVVLLIEKYGDI